jgi:hypothetical protein
MMEALRSSETSVLTRTTRRNTPEGATLYSYRRENLKSYHVLMFVVSDDDGPAFVAKGPLTGNEFVIPIKLLIKISL